MSHGGAQQKLRGKYGSGGWGNWLIYFFFLAGEAQKPDWSEMEDVKQSTALEGREDGWKRKAVCF